MIETLKEYLVYLLAAFIMSSVIIIFAGVFVLKKIERKIKNAIDYVINGIKESTQHPSHAKLNFIINANLKKEEFEKEFDELKKMIISEKTV